MLISDHTDCRVIRGSTVYNMRVLFTISTTAALTMRITRHYGLALMNFYGPNQTAICARPRHLDGWLGWILQGVLGYEACSFHRFCCFVCGRGTYDNIFFFRLLYSLSCLCVCGTVG